MIRHQIAIALLCTLALFSGSAFADPPMRHATIMPSGFMTIKSGDTLDAVLSSAGIDGNDRAAAVLALTGVYELSELKPGHRIAWTTRPGAPASLRSLTLSVDDGVEIALTFTAGVAVERRDPMIVAVDRKETLTLDATLYEALVARGAPERFAVDLVALLAGQVDFHRDLQGGETFALAWQEDRLPNGEVVGEPRLQYARLTLNDRSLELVATSAAGPVLVFEDGEIVQRSAPPILGARLSSVFGKRNHPVLGGVRMHTGIDFAAPTGTEVTATGAGRVAFAGTIRGYGLTVDIDHGGGVVTRYAHLSSIARDVQPGQRLKPGDLVGAVGATGLVSGPNLHYEVRLDGKPVDPMDRDAVPEQTNVSAEDLAALDGWRKAMGYQASQQGVKG